jgi:hypothetical protein
MARTVEKVSVALSQEVLGWARQRAEQQGTSVSAVLSEAAQVARELERRRARQRRAWVTYVKWATDGQGISREDLDAAARELDALSAK